METTWSTRGAVRQRAELLQCHQWPRRRALLSLRSEGPCPPQITSPPPFRSRVCGDRPHPVPRQSHAQGQDLDRAVPAAAVRHPHLVGCERCAPAHCPSCLCACLHLSAAVSPLSSTHPPCKLLPSSKTQPWVYQYASSTQHSGFESMTLEFAWDVYPGGRPLLHAQCCQLRVSACRHCAVHAARPTNHLGCRASQDQGVQRDRAQFSHQLLGA